MSERLRKRTWAKIAAVAMLLATYIASYLLLGRSWGPTASDGVRGTQVISRHFQKPIPAFLFWSAAWLESRLTGRVVVILGDDGEFTDFQIER